MGTATTPRIVKIARIPAGNRVRGTLDLISEALAADGIQAVDIEIPADGLPKTVTGDDERTSQSFAATPGALLESWRVARHLEALTEPGDAVLVTDRNGLGGVFALEQAMLPAEARRRVLTTAADGRLLESLVVAGTYSGVSEDAEFAIDWEAAGYRFADAVLATSRLAIDLLELLGVAAQLVTRPVQDIGRPRAVAGSTIGLPEPVSRLAQTPTMLRGLSAALNELPALRVLLSEEDRDDEIWSGTTWQATEGIRALFGNRLGRSSGVADVDCLVLGDPLAVPPPDVRQMRTAGVPIVVPERSVASALWPDAPSWSNESDLAEALTGGTVPESMVDSPQRIELRTRPSNNDRAQDVSVGVPIFRDVSHLDSCLESILSQDQLPYEILLVDDGSMSEEVDKATAKWSATRPDVIRTLGQPNQGVCAARNLALEHMTGDAFLFIDSDDELAPDFISACARALRANPELDAVATWTQFFEEYEGIEAKPPFDRRVGMRENPIISTTALVDMKVRDLGVRFDPDLAFLYCEDWDFWAQIVAAGGSFGLVPRPLARHRVHHASGGFRRSELAANLGKARATARLREEH